MSGDQKHEPSSDLMDKLRSDVLKTGFVTEMIVAKTMNDAGWVTLDHTYYLDRDENKGREIDVVTFKTGMGQSDRKRVNLNLGLATEIKKSASAPWVIFTSEKPSNFEPPRLFETSLSKLHGEEIWFRDLYKNHPINLFPRLGRACYVAFKKSKPEPDSTVLDKAKPKIALSDDGNLVQNFGAFVSTFKATNEVTGFFKQADKTQLRDAQGVKTYEVGIAHGLLIIDGILVEAVTHAKDEVELRKADWIPYVFNYASKEYGNRSMLIDVIALNHLPQYLDTYSKWLDERANFCLSELS